MTPSPQGLDPEVLDFAHRLFQLARDGDARNLAGYLDAGISPDLTNDKGDCLLMLASYYGREDTVRMLLAHGADTARTNDRGQSPLAGAVVTRCAGAVRALLVAGADPDLGDPSAVEVARFFDLPEMLALLQPAD